MLCRLIDRRSFLHGLVAALGLCSCRLAPGGARRGFVPLREPVVVALDDLVAGGGAVKFEAWLAPPGGGPDKILDGILLDNPDGPAAYCTYCPHEACGVKFERDPTQLGSVVADVEALPEHPVLYCACHFSVFDPRASGRHISGPAPRGLYRFSIEPAGGSVRVTHVEAAILDVYG